MSTKYQIDLGETKIVVVIIILANDICCMGIVLDDRVPAMACMISRAWWASWWPTAVLTWLHGPLVGEIPVATCRCTGTMARANTTADKGLQKNERSVAEAYVNLRSAKKA